MKSLKLRIWKEITILLTSILVLACNSVYKKEPHCLSGAQIAYKSSLNQKVVSKSDDSISSEALKQTDWWRIVQKNIREREYHISHQKESLLDEASEVYQPPKRAQNLRTYFTNQGIKIISRTEKGSKWQ